MRCGILLLTLFAAVLVLCVDGMSFAVIGDWGMGGRRAGWMTEMRSADEVNSVCERIGCNFTISVGDNIYVGDTVRGLQDSFEDMFTSQGPFFPSIGNHDNVGPQLEYTKKNKRWKFYKPFYTKKMPIDNTGYTVQIFAVNTMDGGLGGGGQYTWLENELKNSDARWKFIFGHYPTTGSGRHKRVGTVGRIHSLMEKYNVSAYFCGHDHILEMSNSNGKVLGMSGAMARGGMMIRGLGGKARKFTLTQPNEWNKHAEPWPGHGFLTAQLSPNVMTIQMWDQCGGIQYEFSVTHDWIQKAPTMAASARDQWPSEEIVLQAYKDELTLEKGNGGGTYFAPGGEENGGVVVATPAPAPTPAPTPAPPGSTPQPTTKLPEVTIPNLDKVTEKPLPPQPVPAYTKFSVSTECATCKGPTVGEPFAVFIEGKEVTTKSRVYLTNSILGCDNPNKPSVLDGTTIVSPKSNIVIFTVKGAATNAWVCYSVDGRAYSTLSRVDDVFQGRYFEILSPSGEGVPTPAPPPNQAPPTVAGATPSPAGAPVLAPQPQQGHHTGVVIVIGLLCGVIGAFASVHYKQYLEQQRGTAVPSSA